MTGATVETFAESISYQPMSRSFLLDLARCFSINAEAFMDCPKLIAFAIFAVSSFAARAATPEEESRFLAAVRSAYDAKDPNALMALHYFEGTPDELKGAMSKAVSFMVKQPVMAMSLQPAPEDLAKKVVTIKGVDYRPNLPIRQVLNITISEHGRSQMPVGERNGRLYLVGAEPVK